MSQPEQDLLDAACQGDAGAFDALVAPYRGELHVHCYRMLGSLQDAEDALQNALLGAWRGLPGYEGRSSIRSWLYRITTNACLRLGGQRTQRLRSMDYGPSFHSVHDLGEFVDDVAWLEPCPESMLAASARTGDPAARYDLRESVELAFVAALQHLPATQRAVLILREVLAFPAAEVATLLDTSVPAVHSALQRARKTLDQRLDGDSQQATLESLGEAGQRDLVNAFVAAWERADVPAILDMLVEDARYAMPPIPAWFAGREDINRFLSGRMFVIPRRLVPIRANGQLAFASYEQQPGAARFTLGSVDVLTLRGRRIAEITGFLDRDVHARFDVPPELDDPEQFRSDR
jgi:RNA polymerase sigma-70 factor (ECF subfamily)